MTSLGVANHDNYYCIRNKLTFDNDKIWILNCFLKLAELSVLDLKN